MNIKQKLKERLLKIPVNYRAFREKHRLADDIGCDCEKVEFYLNELVALDILIEKKQYVCPNCGDTVNMSRETLDEYLEDGYFACDNCMNFINPDNNTTGFVYYDIKDREALTNW